VAARWVRLPGVVVEIGLGIVIGPRVLGWAHLHEVLNELAQMGLVFLIFVAEPIWSIARTPRVT
jgi:Kef-type K+ transport system membrane component KefB